MFHTRSSISHTTVLFTMARRTIQVLVILGFLQYSALSFAPAGGVSQPPSFAVRPASSALAARGNEPQFGDPDYVGDPTGLKRGLLIFPLALLFNVWMFSIPVEYRRARICSEEQVRENPDSKCMTTETWRRGVADYYANGGGIKFDFSVDPDASSSATGL